MSEQRELFHSMFDRTQQKELGAAIWQATGIRTIGREGVLQGRFDDAWFSEYFEDLPAGVVKKSRADALVLGTATDDQGKTWWSYRIAKAWFLGDHKQNREWINRSQTLMDIFMKWAQLTREVKVLPNGYLWVSPEETNPNRVKFVLLGYKGTALVEEAAVAVARDIYPGHLDTWYGQASDSLLAGVCLDGYPLVDVPAGAVGEYHKYFQHHGWDYKGRVFTPCR